MSLKIELGPNDTLRIETDHGHTWTLPEPAAEAVAAIRKALQTQRRNRELELSAIRRTNLAKAEIERARLCLAEWERIGPEGAGKVEKPPLTARQFNARGKETDVLF